MEHETSKKQGNGNDNLGAVSSRFILLKGVKGNVFWTTDDGSDHEKNGYTVLHRGTDRNEMMAKWDCYYRGRL